ncbi:MAG: VWA domain-containing protein [Elusimicrobiota bacterium]|nr:VWA domain-containing protein [Elusimicrobiota bacterium]
MIWDNPKILFALLALPFIGLFFVFEWRARRQRCSVYASSSLFDKLTSFRPRAGIFARISAALAFAFFVTALAGPRWGLVSRKVEEKSSSVMIALDVSASMFCEDIKPTRFKASIAKIKYILSLLRSERYGLVGFAGRAFTICPLTGDLAGLRMFLDEISAGEIPYPGTNISEALSKAAESFEDDTNSRAVILLTDGENLQGNPASIVKELKGIRVFVIGVGTPEGEPIPVKDDDGKVTGYKKDEKGETVISRRDETLLLQIANATKGRYFPFDPANRDIEQIADAINSMDKDFMGESFSSSLEKKYPIPLAAALFFMIADFLLPFITRKKTFLDNIPPALILLLLIAAPSMADDISSGNRAFRNRDFFKAEQHYREALKKKASEAAYYNLANTYYFMEKHDDAEKNYRKAATFENPRMEEDLFYNMANNCYRKGDIDAAISFYRRVLRADPSSSDALHNLEMSLRQKSEDGGEKDGEKDKEKEGDMSEDDMQRAMNLLDDMEKSGRKKQEKQKMPAVSQDW